MANKSNRPSTGNDDFLEKLKATFGSLPPKGDPGRKKFHFSLWYFLMALLALSLVHDFFIARQINTVTYSEFKSFVEQQRVDKLILKPQQITGTLLGEGGDTPEVPFVAIRVEDPELVGLLDERASSTGGATRTSGWPPSWHGSYRWPSSLSSGAISSAA